MCAKVRCSMPEKNLYNQHIYDYLEKGEERKGGGRWEEWQKSLAVSVTFYFSETILNVNNN